MTKAKTFTNRKVNSPSVKVVHKKSHTEIQYVGLSDAYKFFNKRLFDDKLPACLITMQRKKSARGYYSPDRFKASGVQGGVDEIALNPATFNDRTETEVLSTLVHEMAHLWQQHFGKPSRGNYHNQQWADKMKAIGLQPSDSGLPDGKETGQSMTHFIIKDAPFDKYCLDFLQKANLVLYSDKQTGASKAKAKKKLKAKFTCPSCDCNAWGKPTLEIMCVPCDMLMDIS